MAEDDETFVERYHSMLDRFANLKAQKEARDLARKVSALSAAQQAAKRVAFAAEALRCRQRRAPASYPNSHV